MEQSGINGPFCRDETKDRPMRKVLYLNTLCWCHDKNGISYRYFVYFQGENRELIFKKELIFHFILRTFDIISQLCMNKCLLVFKCSYRHLSKNSRNYLNTFTKYVCGTTSDQHNEWKWWGNLFCYLIKITQTVWANYLF